MSKSNVTRRNFLRSWAGSALGIALLKNIGWATESIKKPVSSIPTRLLGSTGHQVCLFSLGGEAALEDSAKYGDALRIVNRALDLGVNYIDTAPLYGKSEQVIGEVIKNRRQEIFLASKTHDRSYDGSMRLLEASLKRLQTDHLDLWQLHNVKTQNDLDFIFSREGAIKALEYAREQGLVKYFGITGHKDPFVLRKAIEQYPFHAILIALNAADRHKDSFIEHVLPVAVNKNLGIIGMKVLSRGKIFHDNGIMTAKQAIHYALTLPVSTVVIGISALEELEENVRCACDFIPYTSDEMSAMEQLTKPYYNDVLWYRDHM